MREGAPAEFEEVTAADNSNEGARCSVCGSSEVVEYYKPWWSPFGYWRCDEHRQKEYGNEFHDE